MSNPTRLVQTCAVIGAGPVGLAAAAHLLERGITPVVLEAGPAAGAAIGRWGHVRLFSPWRFDIDPAARRLLEGAGWSEPDPDDLPTGGELLAHYLEPLAAALAPHIRYGARVTGVTRLDADKTRTIDREGRPYLVRTVNADGTSSDVVADAVIDASGVWDRPNPLGAHGLPAPGETADAPWQVGPLPDVLGADRARFAGRRTLVVGAGHSAANTLIALAELAETAPGTEVAWAIRGRSAAKVYGGGSADALPARGSIGTRLRVLVESGAIKLVTDFAIHAFETAADGSVTVAGTSGALAARFDVDNVAAATGFRPDLELLREVRLDLDAAVEAPARLAPLIDPNFHSCGTVPPHGEADLAHPDEGFYIVGVKSYGRAPTFLLATGYEQVRSIAAALAGDREAADQVRLALPETGVCSSSPALDATSIADAEEAADCCGSSAAVEAPARGLATGVLHGRAGERVEPPQVQSGCCG
ncbi:NAD(P)-binding domain-containing protein [Glycomyces sp. TRM65418]|uniref:NAD(P)-binding domain-containing protein n=1 Tax=Glycomyces sp. TRM65418 TaxID=2867006 RepID=UPI001CE5D76F|nr:NAD(P)-binding domain-containing protein [Glycomyces sp. TRM65418]MCC3763439.1 NAD(P)-binding domain-containing protein [Glycomyces sp. TRM65418]QZD57428.1 NAD(P)-binding domain-containing protein [Glycomyces sp. TRM65418]